MLLEDTMIKLNESIAVSGFEESFSLVLKELFKEQCDEVKIDKFFNVIGIKRGFGENRRKVMISAHYDEIGLLIKSIDDNGFIKFTNIGGIDPKVLLAQEVIIHGRKTVEGVIGAKPPHLMKTEETKVSVKMDDLSIDTGLPYEKVKELVSIGDVITIKSSLAFLKGNKISSKANDNRAGLAAILMMMDELRRMNHEHDVYFVASTQEEVGLTGITTASYNEEPDIAIVIDACHGDMPDIAKEQIYNLGKGPAIGIGPNLHRNMTLALISLAKDENIPYQIDVEPGDTGTEAWATQVSRDGIPTALISIPVRYMHTPVETVSTIDITNTARLAARFVNRVEADWEKIICI